MTEDQTIDGLGITRRQALAAAAALCGLGAVAAAGTGEAQAVGSLRVRLSRYPALKKIGGIAVVKNLGTTPVAVVRTGKSTYRAFSRRCPHAGVAVTPRNGEFICLPPGHGSRFSASGSLISGPAGGGLTPLKSKLSRGVLTITS